jgi:hypothetical protein
VFFTNFGSKIGVFKNKNFGNPLTPLRTLKCNSSNFFYYFLLLLFIRMLGALQITPMLEWDACLQLLRNRIDDGDLPDDIKQKLVDAVHYYE